jgi:acetyl/propionyl-CoA carboxylase alpha subunit
MFSKVLIANRGEIACRVIRTCKRLGVKTVAVYSDVDAGSLPVQQADEAVPLGNAAPQNSYLNIEKILAAARLAGADAIHPGYGFLSENPRFARQCEQAGFCFIGPRPEVMEQMGDKLFARSLAREEGLPLLPGTDDAVPDDEAAETAFRLGFPLMVKAAEGGGGIGIHVVQSPEELAPLIERSRQAASGAFGSGRLYFERYLKDASHIEVQLLGDNHGNLVHLFERDCSVQRRNQKLIEETPASAKLPPALRRRLASLAVQLGERISYNNAGTIEFLVSREGSVYFLEMNTRLQVEHGVTEMITGLDLVELQLRVASGEVLPISQDDIVQSGHAIEARIYPEHPETFMPDAGDITDLHLPTVENVRIDSALCDGYTVGLDYEPLVAKVMAWGEDRDRAIRTLQRALLELRLEGVKNNVELLRSMLASKEFTDATHHTGSVPHWVEELRQRHLAHQAGIPAHLHHANARADAPSVARGSEKEIAAAIGVALTMAMNEQSTTEKPSRWRVQRRREQLYSGITGSRGWR